MSDQQVILRLLELVNARRKKFLTKEMIIEWINDPAKDPKNKVKKSPEGDVDRKKKSITKGELLDYVEDKYKLNLETEKKEIKEKRETDR